MAAVEVLEAAGFTCAIPKRNVCCGRPLYDFGMLDTRQEIAVAHLERWTPKLQKAFRWWCLSPVAPRFFATRC